MNSKVVRIVFLSIIIVAAIIRFYKLGHIPLSPNWDEASLGYNAYSILKTGRDEYGKFLPVILRSFDDYKPALYSYLLIPLIYFFGLSISVVRTPSAFFGVLTVAATYFLVKELMRFSPQLKEKYTESIALLSMLLIAISPWHIQFSRVAFESNVGLAFNIFTSFFFLKGLRRPIFLIISFIIAGLNVHMYQSEKVFTPLFLLAFVAIFRYELLNLKKYFFVACITAVILVLPLVNFIIFNPNALMRAKGVSVFSDQTQFLMRNVVKTSYDKEKGDIVGFILDNRRFEYAKAIIGGYISHFDPNWLFITGDIARHHAPDVGLLYIVELPFLFIGIYKLLFGEFSIKTKLLIFLCFLIVPIPASITSGVPHAVRTLNFLPFFQIFVAIGIYEMYKQISNLSYNPSVLPVIKKLINTKKNLKYPIIFLFVTLFVFNFLYFLNQYFVQQNFFHAKEWLYGYREAIEYIKPIKSKYSQIVVSNQAPLDQSYIFFLFYFNYDPVLYQKSGGTVSGGFAENHKGFENFTFRSINWGNEKKDIKTLFIGRPSDFPDNKIPVHTIYYPDRSIAIEIVEG